MSWADAAARQFDVVIHAVFPGQKPWTRAASVPWMSRQYASFTSAGTSVRHQPSAVMAKGAAFLLLGGHVCPSLLLGVGDDTAEGGGVEVPRHRGMHEEIVMSYCIHGGALLLSSVTRYFDASPKSWSATSLGVGPAAIQKGLPARATVRGCVRHRSSAASLGEQVERLASKLGWIARPCHLNLLVSGTRIQKLRRRRTRDTPHPPGDSGRFKTLRDCSAPASARQRTRQGRFGSKVQPGTRYCIARASSRASRPCSTYNAWASASRSRSSSTPRPPDVGTAT